MTKSFLALLGGAVAIAAASTGASGAMAQVSTAALAVALVQPAVKESPLIQGLTAQPMGRQASPLTQPPMAFLQDRFPAKG